MTDRYAGPMGIIEDVCGPEILSRVKPIWGVNEEGEIRGIWRDCGVPNLWYMLGMRSNKISLSASLNRIQETFKCAASFRSMSPFVRMLKSSIFAFN